MKYLLAPCFAPNYNHGTFSCHAGVWMTDKTYFGFQEVESAHKEHLVKGVFSGVASSYDVMNDAMSMGLHRVWKNKMVQQVPLRADTCILDVAGGTGDIAFRLLKKQPTATVSVCDINTEMLQEGKKRAIDHNVLSNLRWNCGNAEALPFEDCVFDAYTIAFGIRNVTNIDKALAEAYRVLKPGGKFVCLEFSHVEQGLLEKLYDRYSFNIIPTLGSVLANDRDSYQYLVESIRQFPRQKEFAVKIEQASFSRVSYSNMTHGVVAIHSGWRV